MSLIPWSKKNSESELTASSRYAPILSLRNEMDRLFERFFEDFFSPTGVERGVRFGTWAPALDVTENEAEVRVRAELPGVNPNELEISVTGNVISIQGEKREEKEDKSESSYHIERSFGSFRRTIELPQSVNPESAKADYTNGVLTISFKKNPSAAPRKINISAAK